MDRTESRKRKLEEELRKLIDEEARAQARKVKKMKVLEGEDGIQNGKEGEEGHHGDDEKGEEKEKGKEGKRKADRARAKMKAWLNEELHSVNEAIRVRKEVAIVRGSVEANKVAEGENLYGDEIERGIEELYVTSTAASAPAASRTAF
jgi:hypothetical protein